MIQRAASATPGLGVERASMLLLHDVDYRHHQSTHRALARQLLDESLPTLHRIKRQGGVDAIGLGINEWEIGYELRAAGVIPVEAPVPVSG